jgi:eukaryotic-like serine/threonine-protein kinase
MADRARLGGRYELGAVLGFGGMAEVHLGRDVRLGREVAVKTLRADLARDPAFQTRFRREAQSAASLNHPAIVAVYDTGEDETPDGSRAPYIVMEYVDGRTLRDILATDGRLLPNRALEITGEVLGALDYSHRAGIVHRDIKPGNVMLTRDGSVKVMDFGIARALTGSTATMTQTAAVVGTAQYLSPEQARGEHVDGRSDIYSTGCLLYELLTGRPPFVGDSPIAVAYQHVREDPVPPSRIDPDIPVAVDAIVLKAMAKNPANRYQSAAEMRADVERALAGRPVEATPILTDAPTTQFAVSTPTQVFERVEEPQDRRRVAYAILTVAVIAIFIVVALVAKSLFRHDSGSGLKSPSLDGLSVQDAQSKLQGLGVSDITVQRRYRSHNCQQPEGLVCDQNPEPKLGITKSTAFTLYVSRGAKPQPVPDLVGKLRADAVAALHDAHLLVGNITKQDSDQPAGTVISQSVPPDSTIGANTPVDFVVASGKAALPDTLGEDKDTATSDLQKAGFVVVVHTKFDPAEVGIVINQTPPGGANARAPQGSTVTIVVGRGPKPTPTPTGSATPSPTATP